MPLFYFDIDDSGRDIPDMQGREFSDLRSARSEALRMLGEVVKCELPNSNRNGFAISVCSESGKVLLTVSLSVQDKQAAA